VKEFDPQELSECNGKNGNRTCIAHRGRVIDVSNSGLWAGGLHMHRHHAGNDLTADIELAPHGLEVLERYPQVGHLKKEQGPDIKVPKVLSWLLARFPLLKRHPHPMTVHFPIVFMFAVPLFNVAYLITGFKSFEITALHCLGAGILFTPVSVITGLLTWWLNYFARPMTPVTIKMLACFLMVAVQIAVFVWRILVPDVLDAFGFGSVIYFFLVCSLFMLVSIIGWFGASLTFPVEGRPHSAEQVPIIPA
jgi:predicted heme/steroid binding protein/uncharacterized membrane protein